MLGLVSRGEWAVKCEILTITPNLAKSVMEAEMRAEWPSPNGVVPPESKPVFWGDSESGHEIL